jgi:hypothetical protein
MMTTCNTTAVAIVKYFFTFTYLLQWLFYNEIYPKLNHQQASPTQPRETFPLKAVSGTGHKTSKISFASTMPCSYVSIHSAVLIYLLNARFREKKIRK